MAPPNRPPFDGFDFDRGQNGMYLPHSMGLPWTPGTLTVTANRAYYYRFTPGRKRVITAAGFYPTTGTGNAADPVEVAIYDAQLGKLATSGAVTGKITAAASGAWPTVSLSVTLKPNRVYYAYWASSAAPGMFAASISQTWAAAAFGTAVPLLEMGNQNTSYPSPTTPVPIATTSVPVLTLVE